MRGERTWWGEDCAVENWALLGELPALGTHFGDGRPKTSVSVSPELALGGRAPFLDPNQSGTLWELDHRVLLSRGRVPEPAKKKKKKKFLLRVPQVQIPGRNLPHSFKRCVSQRPKTFLVSSSAAKEGRGVPNYPVHRASFPAPWTGHLGR